MSFGRGRGRGVGGMLGIRDEGGGAGNSGSPRKVDLVPTIPPLYPPCHDPVPLNPAISKLVPKYNEMHQHMISNFAVAPVSCHPAPPGFTVERYSDRYCAPLQLKKILTYDMDLRRLPSELGLKRAKRSAKRSHKANELKVKRALQKLEQLASMPDDEVEEKEDEEEGGEEAPKRIKTEVVDPEKEEDEEEGNNPNNQENDEDEDEDLDEELDEGNDYEKSHFDNGEGYGDSDEDGLEDSSVY